MKYVSINFNTKIKKIHKNNIFVKKKPTSPAHKKMSIILYQIPVYLT